MVDEVREGDVRLSHRSNNSKIKPAGYDFISSLPDEILQHIPSFIPTRFAIRTSILSRRWKHVWSKAPSLYFDSNVRPTEISETLTYYQAPKITSFDIWTTKPVNAPEIESWMEFASTYKVEKLSIMLFCGVHKSYSFPDSFYVNSSLKQLKLKMYYYFDMFPRCSTVVWKSLKDLSLTGCKICIESFPKILSGCPVLESLELESCYLHELPERFDLSKSLCLRRLVIDCCVWSHGPLHIVAPHLHNLRLRNSQLPFSLGDVSSLTQANLDIVFLTKRLTVRFLQDMVLKVMKKLTNVDELTFGRVFLQILSFAELRGVPFPTFKVISLTLKSMVCQSVVPGIKRLLQNSHGLKKLTLHTKDFRTTSEKQFDRYFNSQGLNLDQYKDQTFPMFLGEKTSPKLVALCVELVLKNTKTIETIIIRVGDDIDETKFEELLQVASTLSRSNNVSHCDLKINLFLCIIGFSEP